MKIKSYNKELYICTTQFLDVFNNIEIRRFSQDGTVNNSIQVPIKYAARSRILKSLERRGGKIKLPIMAASITGLSRNNSRLHSLNSGIMFQNESGSYDIAKNIGIPMTILYTISILTKMQSDMNQILSTIIVNFRPSMYVVWPHPAGSTYGNIKSKIIWDGETTLTYPEEIDESENSRIECDLNFSYETIIFPGIGVNNNVNDGTGEGFINNINLSTADTIQYPGGVQFDGEELGVVETVT